MKSHNSISIAAISMARNDSIFISKWIDYYGRELGTGNLFLLLDGLDQPLPRGYENLNVIRLPHRELPRAAGDRNRSRLVSHFARGLFHRYDTIIAHDIDEYLVVDPLTGSSLPEYLSRSRNCRSLSALGLDVGQHPVNEQPVDPTLPFLEQRSYAHVSARYTKPVVANAPLTWGSGFHRVKGRNFRIDPNLFLFHFGMVDYKVAEEKKGDSSLHKAGWTRHLERRNEIFNLITTREAADGDSFFREARRRQSLLRPLFALNKPGMLSEKPVIRIPERFRNIL